MDKGIQNFVLVMENQVVDYCAADVGTEYYFFGLCINEEFRGQGFATFFIKKMMEISKQEDVKKFALNVDINNHATIQAYLNAGFTILSETIYLRRQE